MNAIAIIKQRKDAPEVLAAVYSECERFFEGWTLADGRDPKDGDADEILDAAARLACWSRQYPSTSSDENRAGMGVLARHLVKTHLAECVVKKLGIWAD